MQRRTVLAALLLAPLAARASSPEEAKKKDKPKPSPPPNPGKPKKGDREAPLSPDDVNLTPDGRNYRAPWKR